MATDLQDNAKYRLWKEFIGESKAVTIASVSLIVAVLSLLMAWMATYDAIHARADNAQQAIHIEQLSDDVATYRFQISLLHADLRAKGYEPVEEKDDE